MAHSAAASRARLASSLSRSHASSPQDDNTFATATGTSFKDIIHSTPQRDNTASQRGLPLNYDQYREPSEHGSDASADMSIELGRGVKRGAHHDDDLSSNAVFSFGNDNGQYEIMGTPPIRQRSNQRKADGTLRKEASVRRATESARANDGLRRSTSGAKQRAASDTLPKLHVESESSFVAQEPVQSSAAYTVRGSRFTSTRQVSTTAAIPTRFTKTGGLETPRRPVPAGNATVQSATYTANQSFMLPDLPNLTELVSGVRNDGTPVIKRGTASRSRFTSASYKPQATAHLTVEGIHIPEDEKAIFASLQLLRDRVNQLEMEKSETQKRSEEYEGQIVDLRSQLAVASRSPDSALGSDDGSEPAGSRSDKARMQAAVKAMQERLERSERKISISDITASRVIKERDALITQIAKSYLNTEDLVEENEAFRESHDSLQAENEDLRNEVDDLKNENSRLREKLARIKSSQGRESIEVERRRSVSKGGAGKRADRLSEGYDIAAGLTDFRGGRDDGEVRSKKEGKTPVNLQEQPQRRRSSDQFDEAYIREIASRIAREVQVAREEKADRARESRQTVNDNARTTGLRSRSKSQQRNSATQDEHVSLRRHVSAPAEMDVSEAESTTELDMTRKSQHSATANGKKADDRDLTVLSELDPRDVTDLRKKLEDDLRARRQRKRAPATNVVETDPTSRSATTRQSIPRKSSLKDLTAGIVDGTGRFSVRDGEDFTKVAKTVRVQSPHSSDAMMQPLEQDTDAGDASMLSNTSRRRRRSASAEGMTSAFIIPDITMHNTQSLPTSLGKNCIQHNAACCTACEQSSKEVEIPMPVAVTDRENMADSTDATIRPSQPPSIALATVIKHLEDEIVHLKIQREAQNRLYNQHDPSLSKRRRQLVLDRLNYLTAEVEKRSNQVYSLYDVLEGQKQTKANGEEAKEMDEEEVEETLMSIGIDPAELSGRVGRKAPVGLDGADEMSDYETDELPWEGLSDVESEEVRGLN